MANNTRDTRGQRNITKPRTEAQRQFRHVYRFFDNHCWQYVIGGKVRAGIAADYSLSNTEFEHLVAFSVASTVLGEVVALADAFSMSGKASKQTFAKHAKALVGGGWLARAGYGNYKLTHAGRGVINAYTRRMQAAHEAFMQQWRPGHR